MPICTQTEFRPESELCKVCEYIEVCKEDHPVLQQYEDQLKEAAEIWRKGKEMESAAKAYLERANQAFTGYTKETGECQYRIGNLSVSYKPTKHSAYVTEKILKFVPKEKLDECKNITEPMVLRITDLDKRRAKF